MPGVGPANGEREAHGSIHQHRIDRSSLWSVGVTAGPNTRRTDCLVSTTITAFVASTNDGEASATAC